MLSCPVRVWVPLKKSNGRNLQKWKRNLWKLNNKKSRDQKSKSNFLPYLKALFRRLTKITIRRFWSEENIEKLTLSTSLPTLMMIFLMPPPRRRPIWAIVILNGTRINGVMLSILWHHMDILNNNEAKHVMYTFEVSSKINNVDPYVLES